MLIFKGKDPFLKIDYPVKINILIENINKESLIFFAPGIKIAAKLVGNSAYDVLVEKYRTFYSNNFDGFYLE